jgi:dihydroneopterin aldolase
MRTRITVCGLQTYAFHGLFSEERQLGQKFTFDITAELSPVHTHKSDDLTLSVRYDALVEETVAVAQSARFHTLEALGEQVARALLGRFLELTELTVNVAKVSPPIVHPVERVGVEIRLTRAELPLA